MQDVPPGHLSAVKREKPPLASKRVPAFDLSARRPQFGAATGRRIPAQITSTKLARDRVTLTGCVASARASLLIVPLLGCAMPACRGQQFIVWRKRVFELRPVRVVRGYSRVGRKRHDHRARSRFHEITARQRNRHEYGASCEVANGHRCKPNCRSQSASSGNNAANSARRTPHR